MDMSFGWKNSLMGCTSATRSTEKPSEMLSNSVRREFRALPVCQQPATIQFQQWHLGRHAEQLARVAADDPQDTSGRGNKGIVAKSALMQV